MSGSDAIEIGRKAMSCWTGYPNSAGALLEELGLLEGDIEDDAERRIYRVWLFDSKRVVVSVVVARNLAQAERATVSSERG